MHIDKHIILHNCFSVCSLFFSKDWVVTHFMFWIILLDHSSLIRVYSWFILLFVSRFLYLFKCLLTAGCLFFLFGTFRGIVVLNCVRLKIVQSACELNLSLYVSNLKNVKISPNLNNFKEWIISDLAGYKDHRLCCCSPVSIITSAGEENFHHPLSVSHVWSSIYC